MKDRTLLIRISLLSVVLFVFHVTGDIAMGYEKGSVLPVIPIAVLFLYGTLVLGERRSGYVIMLLGGLASAAMPVLHWKLAQVANSGSAGFFFVAIVLAMGVTGLFGFILAVQGLWNMSRRQPSQE
jgi:Na+/H+-dicarboxylate symporter